MYNLKQRVVLPRSLTERSKCFFIHDNHFCVIQKKNQSTFPDALKKPEDFFKNESNELSDVFLKHVIEYKLPTTYEKDCMYAVFAFDLETCIVENQLYCEANAAGVYHLDRLYEGFNGDLTEKELDIESQHFHAFDREYIYPVLDMINFVVNNFKGEPKIITNKHGKKISSYKYQFVGQNASGLDKYFVLIRYQNRLQL